MATEESLVFTAGSLLASEDSLAGAAFCVSSSLATLVFSLVALLSVLVDEDAELVDEVVAAELAT